MTLQAFKIFLAISTYSILIPLAIYIKDIRRFSRANHSIGAYVFVAMTCDAIANILFYQGYQTIVPVNIYYIATFILLSNFYFELIFKKRLGYVVIIGGIIYLIVIAWIFLDGPFGEFQSIAWAAEAAILGGYGIVYIVNLKDMIIDRLLDKNLYSYQAINASLLFYFLTTLFLFISTEYVLTNADGHSTRIFWSLHNIANTLKNIGLAVGLYYTGRRDIKTTLTEIERIGRERAGEPVNEHDETRNLT